MTADQADPPSTVPIEHDAAIGRVARSWGHLEHMVDLILWETAEVEQQFGACITAQMGSIHPKLRALGALLLLRKADPKLIKKVDEFQGNLSDLGEQRARTVHDPRLATHLGEIIRWQTTASSKGVVFGPQPETVEQLNDLRLRIARNIKRFEVIKQEIRDEVLASGKKQTLQLLRIVENPPIPDHKPRP